LSIALKRVSLDLFAKKEYKGTRVIDITNYIKLARSVARKSKK
jgi:hypothetical protein